MDDLEKVEDKKLNMELLKYTWNISTLANIVQKRINPNAVQVIDNLVYTLEGQYKDIYPNQIQNN